VQLRSVQDASMPRRGLMPLEKILIMDESRTRMQLYYEVRLRGGHVDLTVSASWLQRIAFV
jgi:hypothetical protein